MTGIPKLSRKGPHFWFWAFLTGSQKPPKLLANHVSGTLRTHPDRSRITLFRRKIRENIVYVVYYILSLSHRQVTAVLCPIFAKHIGVLHKNPRRQGKFVKTIKSSCSTLPFVPSQSRATFALTHHSLECLRSIGYFLCGKVGTRVAFDNFTVEFHQ